MYSSFIWLKFMSQFIFSRDNIIKFRFPQLAITYICQYLMFFHLLLLSRHIKKFVLFSSSICFNSFVLDSSYHSSWSEHILFIKVSFSVDKAFLTSPIKSKVALVAGILETKDSELSSFKSCTFFTSYCLIILHC